MPYASKLKAIAIVRALFGWDRSDDWGARVALEDNCTVGAGTGGVYTKEMAERIRNPLDYRAERAHAEYVDIGGEA